MLILGAFLIISGTQLFKWSINAQMLSTIHKPQVFRNPFTKTIINLLWLTMLMAGLWCLWQESYIIVIPILGYFCWSLFYNFKKRIIKNLFLVYKQLRQLNPEMNEDEILKETISTYFRTLGWDELRIDMAIRSILEVDKDIKRVVKKILVLENSKNLQVSIKDYSKEEKMIDDVFNEVM